MVKHIQTIHWRKPTNCLSVFDHFVGLTFKGLISDVKNDCICKWVTYKGVFFIQYSNIFWNIWNFNAILTTLEINEKVIVIWTQIVIRWLWISKRWMHNDYFPLMVKWEVFSLTIFFIFCGAYIKLS